MKKRYLNLGLIQFLLITLSGWLRRASWMEIDFNGRAWTPSVQFSFYCLAAWLVTIAIAIWFAITDKASRSMLVLLLVLVLPSIEFLLWFALSF